MTIFFFFFWTLLEQTRKLQRIDDFHSWFYLWLIRVTAMEKYARNPLDLSHNFASWGRPLECVTCYRYVEKRFFLRTLTTITNHRNHWMWTLQRHVIVMWHRWYMMPINCWTTRLMSRVNILYHLQSPAICIYTHKWPSWRAEMLWWSTYCIEVN